MTRRFSINFGILAFLIDALLVSANLYAANALRPQLNSLPFVAFFPDPVVPLPLYPIFSLLWGVILIFFAVYDGRRSSSLAREWLDLTGGSLLAGAALSGVLFMSYRDVSRVLFLTFFILAYLSLIGWRLVYRVILSRRADLSRRSRVLIVGANEVGKGVGDAIRANPQSGLVLAGYIDDEAPVETLGGIDDASAVITRDRIDEVVISLPDAEYDRVAALVQELHGLPVRLWVVPNFFQLALFRAGIGEFAGIPMLDLRAPAISEYQRVVKRVLDLAVSLLVLVPGIPLMGLSALAVWLGSGRPVLFRQLRVGENGRPFNIYKFRTMVPGAERIEVESLAHKTTGDPRVTRVGRFLRRTSLDELPQFFNVLKGEMSLVGPRPELPSIVEQYEPWQRQRLSVPPGITGWWQVSGRSERMLHLHTEDDLYYIKNYSLWLDLQIMAKTLWVVIGGKGAW